MQQRTFFEFGNKEDHFKYRDAVMQAYPYGNFPVFDGCNHMQCQIRNPEGFAKMLERLINPDLSSRTDAAVGGFVSGLPEELSKRAAKKISYFVPLC